MASGGRGLARAVIVREWWLQFCEINKRIFRLKGDDFSYFTILGLAAVVGDVVAAFSRIYMRFLQFVVGLLVSGTTLRGQVLAEPLAGHAAFRFGFMFFIMAGLYLALYAVRAPSILAQRARLAADAQGALQTQIGNLERDKQALLPKANYRDQLAAAVGVRFVSVDVRVLLRNTEGDCQITQEEVFQVSELSLGDLVRRRRSSCAQKRETPNVLVSGLDALGTFRHEIEDQDSVRQYHIYFDPKLRNTRESVRLTISEDVQKGFVMDREKFPKPWWTKEPLERISQLIIEPTDRLMVSVDFPAGYRVPEEDFSVQVNYGRTRTRHLIEEQRLVAARTPQIGMLPTGTWRASLVVDKPLLGLAYAMCWRPLELQG